MDREIGGPSVLLPLTFDPVEKNKTLENSRRLPMKSDAAPRSPGGARLVRSPLVPQES